MADNYGVPLLSARFVHQLGQRCWPTVRLQLCSSLGPGSSQLGSGSAVDGGEGGETASACGGWRSGRRAHWRRPSCHAPVVIIKPNTVGNTCPWSRIIKKGRKKKGDVIGRHVGEIMMVLMMSSGQSSPLSPACPHPLLAIQPAPHRLHTCTLGRMSCNMCASARRKTTRENDAIRAPSGVARPKCPRFEVARMFWGQKGQSLPLSSGEC
jgi:hypothetical protein